MWIRRYVLFHGKRHPALLNERHITDFLTKLAVESKVGVGSTFTIILPVRPLPVPPAVPPTKEGSPNPK